MPESMARFSTLIRAHFRGPILMAARDLDLACTVASEMALLDGGRIVQRGTPRTVLDQPANADAARLAGYENLWQGAIATLDRAANRSRVDLGGFSLTVPYLPGHLRGDRVWVAIRAAAVRPRRADTAPAPNVIPAELVRIAEKAQSVRLEFAGPIVADTLPQPVRRPRRKQELVSRVPRRELARDPLKRAAR